MLFADCANRQSTAAATDSAEGFKRVADPLRIDRSCRIYSQHHDTVKYAFMRVWLSGCQVLAFSLVLYLLCIGL